MSETTTPEVPPDVSVTTKTVRQTDGGSKEHYVVKFGTPPRTIEVVDLDLGAQFDLAELTGSVASNNVQYHNLAFVAASVAEIDGVPTAGLMSKSQLRSTLTRLGVDGMKAAGLVLAGYRGTAGVAAPADQAQTETTHRAVVGNS